MGNTTFVSLSLATALHRSLDTSAHNLANASTSGFKASHPAFSTYVTDALSGESGGEGVSYVLERGNFLDTSQGTLVPTGNPLDVALSGPGWFSFETENGRPAYGRQGQLTIDTEGRLTTTRGAPILDVGGAPLILPEGVGQNIEIARDGTVSDRAGTVLGQIGVVRFADGSQMSSIGSGFYLPPAGQQPEPVESPEVAQGVFESSNVQPVVEMTRLMEIQRAYERSISLMNEDHELTRRTLQRLGETS